MSANGYEIIGCENWAVWSCDGKWISYHRRNNALTDDISEIWLMRPDGTEKHVLVGEIPDGQETQSGHAAPTAGIPGSQGVAFKTSWSDIPIFIIKINEEITQLTEGYSDGRMWWGPTGDKILFKEYSNKIQHQIATRE